MKKFLLSTLCVISPFVYSSTEAVYLHYDEVLDGVTDFQKQLKLNIDLSGNTVIGKTEAGALISGNVENTNSQYIGSGEKPRFQFEIHNGETRNWYFGNVNGKYWEGVWFGANGEKGDFSLYTDLLTKEVPQFENIIAYYADEVFQLGGNNTHNSLNSSFLIDSDNLEPHFINDEYFDTSNGLFLQADVRDGNLPLSFYIDYKKPMPMKTFRLGSFNNGEGTRLRTFSFDIWKDGDWQTVENFEFAPIYAPTYQRQEFSLPRTVYAERIRISATATDDYTDGSKLLMWGLSFKR
ncbi:hypothetical protein Shal_3482 [Shewanella halifaxensis HAW-EB4]|uniref:Uncharacterized protein n=1 Tax=Shewanella halifaxensis (strain HAW-EB4) TaxID=458817 RepID=B0TT86_SHEHH|nr:hypothetical protein [Shewanella halifaxensis]ABZ78027.1 hypothetical protein Shal_3482 [Shewanella halifaxensis HAW-EB4]